MNNATVTTKPYIVSYDPDEKMLVLCYRFTNLNIIPYFDPIGRSPDLLLLFRHVWLDSGLMNILELIPAGNFTDGAGTTIQLAERYRIDNMQPTGIIPNFLNFLPPSYLTLKDFTDLIQQMFVYNTIIVTYRAVTKPLDAVPATHVKVTGQRGASWWIPDLTPDDFPTGTTLLGFETYTPNLSGYAGWYDDGGRMFIVFHPCIVNALLRSNLPATGFGTAPDAVWTKKLISTNENHPACVPDFSVYSADMNAHWLNNYCDVMQFQLDSVSPNHERGAWDGYDWTSSIGPYNWSHADHGNGCPLACELCYKNVTGYGDDALTIRREWILGSYGEPGSSNRDLYEFLSGLPDKEYFSSFQGYAFVNGLEIDEIANKTMVAVWDNTGPYSYPQHTHYGGLVNQVRYNDMIILDRAAYFLDSNGVSGGRFTASPINYLRNYRHGDDERRDGTLYILGQKIPDDYIVYPRPEPGPPPLPWPIIINNLPEIMQAARIWVEVRPYDLCCNGQKILCDGQQITCGDID